MAMVQFLDRPISRCQFFSRERRILEMYLRWPFKDRATLLSTHFQKLIWLILGTVQPDFINVNELYKHHVYENLS